MWPVRPLLAALTAGLLVAACAALGSDAPGADAPAELTVFAAASLRTAIEEAERAYEASVEGVDVVLSTDSSAALATQIEQGAPADVFLSADTTNPERLVDLGLAAAVVPFAANRLTIIVPTGNPASIRSVGDLARDGVRIIAAGDEVPISRYAAQLVRNLAATPGYPPDIAAAYARNIATKEDNVAAVVTKIELGEGDAAVVYVTDAARSDAVEAVAVPAEANVVATYGAVILETSERGAAARAFLDWLTGPAGQAILAASGFEPPDR